MSESLIISTINKKSAFETLIPQIESLMEGEQNLIANLANISSAIQMTFNYLWVGFYLIDEDQLVLGPFQGPIACTRIKKGKGVCGSSWATQKTIVVKNVNEFEGHIACSSESISEIVVPIFDQNETVIGVLDVDAITEGEFDHLDQEYFEKITQLITQSLP